MPSSAMTEPSPAQGIKPLEKYVHVPETEYDRELRLPLLCDMHG